jgi:glycerate kinase
MRVLIAPDKFKGTLTAAQAATAIASGWTKARPEDRLDCFPISDGGDGFGEVLSNLWGAQGKSVRTVDAAHRPIRGRWSWDPKRKAAIIDSAAVIGLAQLPPKRFHPFNLDTFGLGKVIQATARAGARRCFIGIGGSATNDAGFGLARALGWNFLARSGQPIVRWTDLHKLNHLSPPSPVKSLPDIIVAVDVQNPLLGKYGATRVYGPQKGLTSRDFPTAEKSLQTLARVVGDFLGKNIANLSGAGAAGGLGFGLAAFLQARLEPGFELFAREARLLSKLCRADLVITGEGRLDSSTLMGKGVGELAKLCLRRKIPCIALGGDAEFLSSLRKTFTAMDTLTSLTTSLAAQTKAALWLKRLSEKTARHLDGIHDFVLS